MTDGDEHGGGDDDPQLTSLRAVWLSMPDEEPPQRGLADLMAAARVKADEMATPTLWQRIVALLRRPPVLALATVMVLIGGGIFIGRRADTMQAELPPPATAPAEVAAPVPTETTVKEGAPEPAPPAVKAGAPEPAAPAVTPRAPTREETRKPARRTATSAPPPEPLPPPRPRPAPRDDVDMATSDRLEAPGAAGGAVAPSAAFESQRPATLIEQAKTAASRGDCPSAAALLKRVAAEDEKAYRTVLASDAALKKCVAAAQ